MDKEMGVYLKEIEKSLVCSKGEKKIYLKDLKNSIQQFIQEEKIVNFSKVREHFGTPTDIAESYLTTVDVADIKKKLSVKRMMTTALVFLIILVVFFYLIAFVDTSYLIDSIQFEDVTGKVVASLCKKFSAYF